MGVEQVARPWWRRRTPLVALAAAVVVLAAGALVAVRTIGAGPDPLPPPRTAAREPAGRITWTVPKDCGVTGATLDALVPHRKARFVESPSACVWDARTSGIRGDRQVRVDPFLTFAGAGVPNGGGGAGSPVANAITAYRQRAGDHQPVTGLGDEAAIDDDATSFGRDAEVVFRAGNAVLTVTYSRDGPSTGGKYDRTARKARSGALRAARDVADRLGAGPSHPAVAVPPAGPAPATLPFNMCRVLPKALSTRLTGAGARGATGVKDPLGPPSVTDPTVSCTWQSASRGLSVSIRTSDRSAGTALPAVRDEYLRRYFTARDEPPVSAGEPRYFHSLPGLGDQAFCAYLGEPGPPGLAGTAPARVVVRVGVTLVTVVYGSRDGDPEARRLTLREAVAGAYAAARPVVAFLRD